MTTTSLQVHLACKHGHADLYTVRPGGTTECKACRSGKCDQCGPEGRRVSIANSGPARARADALRGVAPADGRGPGSSGGPGGWLAAAWAEEAPPVTGAGATAGESLLAGPGVCYDCGTPWLWAIGQTVLWCPSCQDWGLAPAVNSKALAIARAAEAARQRKQEAASAVARPRAELDAEELELAARKSIMRANLATVRDQGKLTEEGPGLLAQFERWTDAASDMARLDQLADLFPSYRKRIRRGWFAPALPGLLDEEEELEEEELEPGPRGVSYLQAAVSLLGPAAPLAIQGRAEPAHFQAATELAGWLERESARAPAGMAWRFNSHAIKDFCPLTAGGAPCTDPAVRDVASAGVPGSVRLCLTHALEAARMIGAARTRGPEVSPAGDRVTEDRATRSQAVPDGVPPMARMNCEHGQHTWHNLPDRAVKRCIYCPATARADWIGYQQSATWDPYADQYEETS